MSMKVDLRPSFPPVFILAEKFSLSVTWTIFTRRKIQNIKRGPFGRQKQFSSSKKTFSLPLVGIIKTFLYSVVFLFYFISFKRGVSEERSFWRLSLSDRTQWSEHSIYIAVWHCTWPRNIWQLASVKGPWHELSLGLINFCFHCKWPHFTTLFLYLYNKWMNYMKHKSVVLVKRKW